MALIKTIYTRSLTKTDARGFWSCASLLKHRFFTMNPFYSERLDNLCRDFQVKNAKKKLINPLMNPSE